MTFISLTYAITGFILAYIAYTIFTALTSPLRAIPGPFLARFTNLWYFLAVSRGNFHHENIALHKKYAPPNQTYAPIIRLGPNLYSLTRAPKNVYGIGSTMPKSAWYEGWKHPCQDRWTMFPDQNMKRHAETRRKFQGLYSLSSLVTYEGYVDQCGDLFLRKLREVGREGRTLDMSHWFACCAFDVIGEITYSKRLGFLDEGRDVGGVMRALDAAMVYGTLVGIYHRLHPLIYRLTELIPGSGASGRNHIMTYARERVSQREAQRLAWSKEGRGVDQLPSDAPRDFLDRIMDMRDEGTKNVTDYHVFMMCLSNMFAGSDTTSLTLSSILWRLIKNPKAMEKLRGELEGKMEGGRIEFRASQEMPYLQGCIKEGLRLNPAAGLPLWRVVPEGGAEICGRWFPAGSDVGINAWVAHRDRSVWGEDVDEFRPERWIAADAEKLKEMEVSYLPFGLGSRTCIGRHISILEISKLIPLLVWHLDFELASPDAELKTKNFWFVKIHDFNVRIKPRFGV